MLEYRLLRAGEEEAALNFFYSNFVAKEQGCRICGSLAAGLPGTFLLAGTFL